jgi:hypothetical protein
LDFIPEDDPRKRGKDDKTGNKNNLPEVDEVWSVECKLMICGRTSD